MAALLKTDKERLQDAEDIIRKKNLENNDHRRTIRDLRQEKDTAEAIRREIFKLSEYTVDPPKWLSQRGPTSGNRGCPIAVWSDFHYGEVIDPDQVGGVNKYNMNIAKSRFKTLVDSTIDICENHMGRTKVPYPGIVVALGGDLIGGDIHEELMVTNDRTPHQSVHDLTDLLGAGIETVASKFGRVFVPCVVGNHGRSTHKVRSKTRVYTNYDWSIYCNLEREYRKDKRITVMVPSETDAHFAVYGHRFLLTHGDSLGVKGGDGIIGAIGPIMRGLMKLHTSKAQIGQDFDTAIICHWHQFLPLPGIIVNGSFKGYDEYSMLRLRARYEKPTQALIFVHPDHGITVPWPVFLEKQSKVLSSKEWVKWLT